MEILLFGTCVLWSVPDLFPLSLLFESCVGFYFVLLLFVLWCKLNKEPLMAQKLLISVLPYIDKNDKSAMFILACFQLSVYSLVSVSRGSVQECTGLVDSKAPAETPAKIPWAFLWNASPQHNPNQHTCACFSKQDLQGVHFWLQPAWPMSPSVSHSTPSLKTTELFFLWRILINQEALRPPP